MKYKTKDIVKDKRIPRENLIKADDTIKILNKLKNSIRHQTKRDKSRRHCKTTEQDLQLHTAPGQNVIKADVTSRPRNKFKNSIRQKTKRDKS